MKEIIEHSKYNTKLEASDWRFSASILGLIQYFEYHVLDYEIKDDYILYNSKDIDEKRYLEFVEYKYADELHHKFIENILLQDEITEEQIRLVNDKLVNSNIIMKKVFKNINFDGSNKKQILDILNENREILIKETYGKKQNGYANYISVNMKASVELLKRRENYCRLIGYKCPDEGRKSKMIGYNFDKNNYVANDELEFDFIPFSFIGSREFFFINDNFTIKKLKQANDTLTRKVNLDLQEYEYKNKDARKVIFKSILESTDFIDYDVEVIVKDINKEYFETLYIRKDAINIFKKLNKKEENFNYDSICFTYKINDNYRINIQKEITDNILNNIVIDEFIELILKDKEKKDRKTSNHTYKVSQMIKINILIRGDKIMKDRLKGAYACAKKVVEVLPENKISSYRQKLISSIIFKDYDRANQILLQLSNYSGIEFGFVYDLFENFDENKDIAYTFINALNKDANKEENN